MAPGVIVATLSVPTPEVHNPNTSQEGTRRLALSVSNWLSCLAFPSLYLISIFVGATWETALMRGLVGAVAIRFLGPWLFYLLVDNILTAITESRLEDGEGDDA